MYRYDGTSKCMLFLRPLNKLLVLPHDIHVENLLVCSASSVGMCPVIYQYKLPNVLKDKATQSASKPLRVIVYWDLLKI